VPFQRVSDDSLDVLGRADVAVGRARLATFGGDLGDQIFEAAPARAGILRQLAEVGNPMGLAVDAYDRRAGGGKRPDDAEADAGLLSAPGDDCDPTVEPGRQGRAGAWSALADTGVIVALPCDGLSLKIALWCGRWM
jgi:hypothetical protein